MNGSPNLLVIGPAWIGDMVMAQSLFMALRRRYPACRLDVAGPRWALALLERMPEVDEAICADIAHGELGLAKRWRLGRTLRQNNYDQAFLMSRSLKSALIPWFARVPQRTGYPGELRYGIVNDVRHVDRAAFRKKVQHYVALGLPRDASSPSSIDFDAPRLSVNETNRDALVATHGLSAQRPIVALAPGAAYGAIKRWPADHFAALAKALTAQGYDCWILGGEGDTKIGEQIASAAPGHCVNLCGRTQLSDTVDILSLTQTMVGNDTGLMHIASAVIDHVVALYGPTPPDYAPPLCDKGICLWRDEGDTLKKAEIGADGHARSLHNLPVEDVVRACLSPEDSDIPSRYFV